MKYYLSSFRFGNPLKQFKELSNDNNNIVAYIPNAIDYLEDEEFKNKIMKNDIIDLKMQGLKVRMIDLHDYFGKLDKLRSDMNEVGYIWITGGNSFVLNQAFRLSGFDVLLKEYAKEDKEIVYGGFSCATYVIGPSLNGLDIVDDPNESPYNSMCDIIWEGLGLIDYVILPHYKSEHLESQLIDGVIDYMKDNNIVYKAIKDGEVIIIE